MQIKMCIYRENTLSHVSPFGARAGKPTTCDISFPATILTVYALDVLMDSLADNGLVFYGRRPLVHPRYADRKDPKKQFTGTKRGDCVARIIPKQLDGLQSVLYMSPDHVTPAHYKMNVERHTQDRLRAGLLFPNPRGHPFDYEYPDI